MSNQALYRGITMEQRINGPQGWYDIAYNNLNDSVRGLIEAGMPVNRALVIAFDESAASKGIKHRIEDEIRSEFK